MLALAVALLGSACSIPSRAPSSSDDDDGAETDDGSGPASRRHVDAGIKLPDARVPDARVPPPPDGRIPTTDARQPAPDAYQPPPDARQPPPDAHVPPADAHVPPPDGRAPSPDAGGTSGPPGVVACYLEGDPDANCTLPQHCCFGNYSSAHDGECSNSVCTWGTISCDGPEDCGSGEYCCAHAMIDPDSGLTGYKLACQASACGSAPVDQEMCHPGSTPAGTCSGKNKTCVSVVDNDDDLPPVLHICQ